MRENIGLYRGKRIDNDEWAEGCLVKKIDPMLGVEYCFILAQEYDTSCIDGKPTHLKSFMTWYKVDPETVGEYTGLNANGKKIFEGDIVKGIFLFGEQILSVVKFSEGSFGLAWQRGNVEEFSPFTGMCNVEYEIIGNIHDNPELLGGDSP